MSRVITEVLDSKSTIVYQGLTSTTVERENANGKFSHFATIVGAGSIELPIGTYTFTSIDACGKETTGTIEVFPDESATDEALLEAIDGLQQAIEQMQEMQVEFDLVSLGCTTDEDGEMTGKVVYQKALSEDDGSQNESLLWIGVGSTAPVPYDAATHGEWGECPVSSACDSSDSQGLLTDISNLWD